MAEVQRQLGTHSDIVARKVVADLLVVAALEMERDCVRHSARSSRQRTGTLDLPTASTPS